MPELKLDMTVPLGTAGHARLAIDIADITALTANDREFLADTVSEFCAHAARTLTPQDGHAVEPTVTELKSELAAIYDPSASVLAGVTGTRRNTS